MRTIFIATIAALAISGCATSLAPSDDFNDWTNSYPTAYSSKQRSATAQKSNPTVATGYPGASESTSQ